MRLSESPKLICLLCVGLLLACQRSHHQAATPDHLQPSATQQVTAAENLRTPPKLPPEFVKAFRGTINHDLPILLLLKRSGEDLSGTYIYESRGDNLDLSGKLDPPGSLRLEEAGLTKKGEPGSATGVFTGRFTSAQTIEGTWTKTQSHTALPFYLKEIETTAPGNFQGDWTWTQSHSYLSFDLTLKQQGNKLTGKYDAILLNGEGGVSKIDPDSSLTGTIEGSLAKAQFKSGFAGQKGQAILIHTGDFLLWCDVTSGYIESYDPRLGILRRTPGKGK